jgi:hypothetical protein
MHIYYLGEFQASGLLVTSAEFGTMLEEASMSYFEADRLFQ